MQAIRISGPLRGFGRGSLQIFSNSVLLIFVQSSISHVQSLLSKIYSESTTDITDANDLR